MGSLVFGTSAWSRTRGNLPDLPLVNMFVEATPTTETGVVLQSFPGLEEGFTVGVGPVRGIFQADGVLGGDTITFSGSTLYRGTVEMGTVLGDGPVSFAADEDELVINAGAGIYRTTGTTVDLTAFPDGADVARVAVLGGYFFAIRKDTQQLYFSAVLDGSSWEALDYVSAENDPDPLRDMLVVNDTLILFGSKSVEFWAKSGNADAPVTPIEGRVFPKGVVATGCAEKFDNTAAWIGAAGSTPEGVKPSLRVYVAGNIAEGISDPGIEEKLADSETFKLWSFTFEGHEFLAVRLDTGTWLFDAETRQWCEAASYGRDNRRVQCAVGGLFGDDETGTVWKFGDGHIDAGGVLERRFRAGISISGGGISFDNVRLLTNVGETVELIGDYADPVVEMRTSRDGGRTWGNWRQTALGAQGKYRKRVEWRRNGMFDEPGMLAEFRVTDPVPFRVSAVKFNETGGGRSR